MHQRFGAIQAEAEIPAADAELARHGLDSPVRHCTWAVVPLLACRHAGGPTHRAFYDRIALYGVIEFQGTQCLDNALKIGVVPELISAQHVAFGLRHQPDAELGDNAKIRLHEHGIVGRTETCLEYLPVVIAVHCAHAGAHELAVRQHHFHSALNGRVIAVWGRAEATLECIADHAAPDGGR